MIDPSGNHSYPSTNLLSTTETSPAVVRSEANEFILPGVDFLLTGVYHQEGDDLIVVNGAGEQVRVEGYFASDTAPVLKTAEGMFLVPETVEHLLTPNPHTVQVAGPNQWTPPPGGQGAATGSAKLIGTVDQITGKVKATNKTGGIRTLKKGAQIFEGDVIETAEGGLVKMKFLDDTLFQLGEKAKSVMDKFVYDPDSAQGEFGATVVTGMFGYTSGKLASLHEGRHTLIRTPSAAIGVRGSELQGEVTADGKTTVVHTSGVLDISDPFGNGTITLLEPGSATAVSFGETPAPVFRAPAAMIARFQAQLPKTLPEKMSEDNKADDDGKSDKNAKEAKEKTDEKVEEKTKGEEVEKAPAEEEVEEEAEEEVEEEEESEEEKEKEGEEKEEESEEEKDEESKEEEPAPEEKPGEEPAAEEQAKEPASEEPVSQEASLDNPTGDTGVVDLSDSSDTSKTEPSPQRTEPDPTPTTTSNSTDVIIPLVVVDDPLEGQFLDNAVVGLTFKTDTLLGNTDGSGTFKYEPGETVTFSIGGIELGSFVGGGTITPLDLAEGLHADTLSNLLRFLQSLDSDNDLSNGINISSAALSKAADIKIDFNVDSATFESNTVLTSFLSEAGGSTSLVSASLAMAHFAETLSSLSTISGLSDLTTTLDENSDSSSAVSLGSLVATDETGTLENISFSIVGGTDSGSFIIEGGELKIAQGTTLDYETQASYEVSISAIDQTVGSIEFIKTISLTLNDINDLPTGSITINGLQEQGEQLTVDTSALLDDDGLGTYSYQWQAGGVDISGAINDHIILSQNEVGKTITVITTYTDGGNTVETVTSNATGTISNINDDPTGTVTIAGLMRQGETLSAANAAVDIEDLDGLGTISYQWQRDGVEITGATNDTYLLTQDEVDTTITVVASYTDGYDAQESVTSASSTVANLNDDPTGSVTISGIMSQGETLTATNTLADLDGIGTISYQWQRDGIEIAGATNDTYLLTQGEVDTHITVVASYTDGYGAQESLTSASSTVANLNDDPTGSVTISGVMSQGETLTATNTLADLDGIGTISYQWQMGGIDITGATNDTYVLTQDEVGKNITVVASYTDGYGAQESLTSASSTVANLNDDPTGSVTISGVMSQGETLTATNTLADLDGLGTVGYQWQGNGFDITGATNDTYVLTQDEVGKNITVVASYTDDHGTVESVTSSSPTSSVANTNDNPTGSLTISGIAAQGETLTAVSSLADLDGLTTLNYQWQVDGVDISGATTNTYLLTQSEVGKNLTVTASYTDGYSTAQSITSSSTTTVNNVNDAPTGLVTISGSAQQGAVLTATQTLNDLDGLGTISYQWQRDGIDINGATTDTYTLGQDEVGTTISVVASYTDGYGTLESVTSSTPSDTVTNINDSPTGTVTISGTAEQGETLTAISTLTDLDGLGTFSYQWESTSDRGNSWTDIPSATLSTYTLLAGDADSAVRVSIHYIDGQGTAESFVSSQTQLINGLPIAVDDTTSYGTTSLNTLTLGAADWEGFDIAGEQYLAVANQTDDGTNFIVNSEIYQWDGSEFGVIQTIQTSGTSDWESFTIGGEQFLAVSQIRDNTGYGNVYSEIYKWNGSQFDNIQGISTQGANNWESFEIDGQSYLAVANGYDGTYFNLNSEIYQWDVSQSQFIPYQTIATEGAYDWESFIIDGESYLAVANHQTDSDYTIDSVVYKWDGAEFVSYQTLATTAAYDWESFSIGDKTYLAVANHYDDVTNPYQQNSEIFEWNNGQFTSIQTIATAGAYSWESFEINGESYLAVANLRSDTTTYETDSQIYKWNGSSQFELFQTILTDGALGWESFEIGGESYLAVANYRNDTGFSNINSNFYRYDLVTDQFVDATNMTLGLYTQEDTAFTITISDLLLNDSDPNSTDSITITNFGSTTNGTLIDNGNGTLTYTPTAQYYGTDSFTYTLSDSNGSTSEATVNIDVLSVNELPTITLTDPAATVAFNASTITIESSQGVTLGDFNGDGAQDIFFNTMYTPGQLWFGNGDGTFTDSGQALGGSNFQGRVARSGDLDGDGDLDLLVTSSSGTDEVYLNNGLGIFRSTDQAFTTSSTYGAVLGDVDGDGDLDFVTAQNHEDSVIWLNNGNGIFSSHPNSISASVAQDVALGDLDGDGDLDLVFANVSQTNSVFLNVGTGLFTNTAQTLGTLSDGSMNVVLGDVDGDGDLDAIFAGYYSANKVFFNNGTGVFTDSNQTLGMAATRDVILVDVDSDGDLDMVANNDMEANKIWINDGKGTFTDSGLSLGSTEFSYPVRAADFDGDGDLDLLQGTDSGGTVWLNATTPAGSLFTEDGGAVVVNSSIVLTDTDNEPLTGANIRISDGYVIGEDILSFTDTTTITGSWNSAFGILTLTGSDTVANYQAALNNITFANTSQAPDTQTRTVSFTVNDGTVDSAAVTSTISVQGVNDAPFALPLAHQGAMMFDGVDDLVTINETANLSFSGPLTLEAWIKTNSKSSLGAGNEHLTDQLIMGRSDSGHDFLFMVTGPDDTGNEGLLQFQAGTSVYSTTAVDDGQWHHVAAVYDGSTVTLYIDGQADTSYTPSQTFNNSGTDLTIGGYGTERNFAGEMDDVRFWNDARTAQEIQDNYSQQLSGIETGLVGYWDFNNVNGSMVEDRSTQNNDAYLGEATATSVQPPLSNRHSLSFDGTDDELTIYSGIDLATGSFTWEIWSQRDTQSTNNALFGQGDNTADGNGLYVGYVGGVFQFTLGGSLYDLEVTASDMDGQWHHWAGSFDQSTNTMILYKDGSEVGRLENISGADYTGSGVFNIGNGLSGDSHFFSGKLSDVRIWSDVRSATEIQKNYQQALTGNEGDLLVNYPMASGYGTTLDDISPNNNYDNISGPTWVETNPSAPQSIEHLGQALGLQAGSQGVTVDNPTDLVMGGADFTIESWFKGTDNVNIFSKTDGSWGSNSKALWIDDNGLVSFGISGILSSVNLASTTSVDDGQWHHVAMSYNQTNTMLKLYLDGTLEATHGIAMTEVTSHSVKLGDNAFADTQLDNMRYWSTERSQAEIQENMNESLTGTESNLEGLWQFNGTSNDLQILDLTGNGHNTIISQTDSNTEKITTSPGEAGLYDGTVFYTDDQPVSGSMIGVDTEGDSLSYAIAESPQHGSVTLQNGAWTYVPGIGTALTDSFIINALDGQGGVTPQTITIQREAKSEMSLTELNGDNGFVINGVAVNDKAAWQVKKAGDINADGYDDVIIGAPYADGNSLADAGTGYVVFGSENGFVNNLDLADLDGSNGFAILGAGINAQTGWAVSGNGDYNGDHIDDIILTAPAADVVDLVEAGVSYVVYGSAYGFSSEINLTTDLNGYNGFTINGVAGNDLTGEAVSNAGDINGDGIDDLIIGAPVADPDSDYDAGKSYVLFGNPNGFSSSFNLSGLDGSNGFTIEGAMTGDQLGISVSGAGDFNNDGIDDLIIGANWADPNATDKAGISYILYGKKDGFASTLDLTTDLTVDIGTAINGEDVEDNSAWTVSTAGDFNGDGIDDLIIGAGSASPDGQVYAGKSYLVYGKTGGYGVSLDLSALDGSNGFVMNGIGGDDYSGQPIANAGDVNGDGLDDLIIGASGVDLDGTVDAGAGYLLFGSQTGYGASLNLSDLDGSNGFVINGISAGDYVGDPISGAGDFNGDGYDDLLIGASGADPNGISDAGSSYIVYGGDFRDEVTHQGTSDNDTLSGSGNDDILVGGLGDDHFDGQGGNDVINAGAGSDSISFDAADTLKVDGGTGYDTLQLLGSGETLDLTALNNNPYDDIERIDLTGTGNNTLTLTSQDLREFTSDNRQLLVDGDSGDVVNASDADGYWLLNSNDSITVDGVVVTTDATGMTTIDGNSYISYATNYGLDTLLVNSNVTLNFSYSATLNVNALNGDNGFTIHGVTTGDKSGISVSHAGDINGDGIDDLIVGADLASPNAITTGASYVVFGNESGFSANLELSSLDGSNGFALNGELLNDHAGYSVDGAGDINGDGVDDLIIGAYLTDSGGKTSSGNSYVVFGSTTTFSASLELSSLDGSNGFVVNGIAAGDYSGFSVSGAGDFNNDGIDDLIIGAYKESNAAAEAGASYIIYGKQDWSGSDPFDLSSLNSSNGFTLNGMVASGHAGVSVNQAGDINGDGIDDIIIGASDEANGALLNAGVSYVLFGQQDWSSETNYIAATHSFDLGNLDGNNGFKILGAGDGDKAGRSVSSAGDLNGDGIDDLIIGAYLSDTGGTDSGSSYVVYGKQDWSSDSSLNLTTLSISSGFAIHGSASNDKTGRTVSSAGDVNSDGYDDIIIGGAGVDADGNTDSGASYLIFGQQGGIAADITLSDLDGSNGFMIEGSDAGSVTTSPGQPVSSAGDINNDGYDDLIMGAYLTDTDGITDIGASYVIYGRDFRNEVTHQGTSVDDSLIGTDNDDIMIGGAGDDFIKSLSGDDVIHAGSGDDTIIFNVTDLLQVDGGSGYDTMELMGTGKHLDLTNLSNNIHKNIEKVDLTGDGDNTLSLEINDLLDFSDDIGQLLVDGNAGDVVNAGPAADWTLNNSGSVDVKGTTYSTDANGFTTTMIDGGYYISYGHAMDLDILLVKTDVTLNFS
jgi:hypothetical protein